MKTILKVALLCLCLMASSCKPSPQKAENYYDEVTAPIQTVLGKEDELIRIINVEMGKSQKDALSKATKTETESKEIDFAFTNLQLQVTTSLNQLKMIKDFDGKSVLKNSAVELLNEYKNVCGNEYARLLAIVKIPSADYTNEHDNEFLKLTEIIDNKLQGKVTNFTKEVKVFAAEYKFALAKDSIK